MVRSPRQKWRTRWRTAALGPLTAVLLEQPDEVADVYPMFFFGVGIRNIPPAGVRRCRGHYGGQLGLVLRRVARSADYLNSDGSGVQRGGCPANPYKRLRRLLEH